MPQTDTANANVDAEDATLDIAEFAASAASDIAWVIPGAEPVAAALSILGAVLSFGRPEAKEEADASNQDILDSIARLQVHIDQGQMRTLKAKIMSLHDRLETDQDCLQRYHDDTDGTDFYAKSKDGAESEAYNNFFGPQSGGFAIDAVSESLNEIAVPPDLPATSDPTYKAKKNAFYKANVGKLTLYILARTYIHLYYYNRLVVIQKIHNADPQNTPCNDWSDCKDNGAIGILAAFSVAIKEALDFALPILEDLKEAYLQRPNLVKVAVAAYPNRDQAIVAKFYEYTTEHCLDLITEEEVDAHLQTMNEWKSTLGLKLKEQYKGKNYHESNVLSFLFETEIDGTEVDRFSNSELLSGDLAVQHVHVLPIQAPPEGTDYYYQFSANDVCGSVLSKAGQLKTVNNNLEAEYDVVTEGARKAALNSGKGYTHSTTDGLLAGAYFSELTPSKPIGSKLRGIVFAMVPPWKDLESADFSKVDTANFSAAFARTLSIVLEQNKVARKRNAKHPDQPQKPIFEAIRLDWPIAGKNAAANKKLASLMLSGLKSAATSCTHVSRIKILIPAPARQAFIDAGISQDKYFKYNMRGFQIQP